MKKTILVRTCLTVALSALLLTACNKAPTQDSQSTEATASTAPAETATADNAESPTIKMTALALQTSVLAMLSATANETQIQCLLQPEAMTTYFDSAKAQLKQTMNDEQLKASDAFYRTEVGQKFLTYIEQEMAKVTGKPIEGEPVTITEEDKAKVEAFKETEAGKALTAAEQNIDPQKVMENIQALISQEKTRCNIS